MPSATPEAKIRWEDWDLPVSTQFDDPYYSRQDGLAEARHVFLAGNGLPDRFVKAVSFTIAELGFGTGLNFLASVQLWQKLAAPKGRLTYVAFERYPMTRDQMGTALAHWPELADLRQQLLDVLTPDGAILPQADLVVVTGDARDQVPQWDGAADAWFLDGFAPSRNPEMWDPALLSDVYRRTLPGGSFATYSVAGVVRRGLLAAGFDVTRAPGYGRKREMLTGTRAE